MVYGYSRMLNGNSLVCYTRLHMFPFLVNPSIHSVVEEGMIVAAFVFYFGKDFIIYMSEKKGYIK